MSNDEYDAINAQLEIARRRYADLFDTAPVGYVLTDGSGAVTDINRAASEIVAADRSLLLGKPFAALVERGDRARWTAMLGFLREGRACEPEVFLLGRVDQEASARARCRITGAAEIDERGKPRLYRWILEDFDALELVAGAQQMALEAQRKDEFLAMLGHELRNPLAPIRAAVELWRANDGQLTEQQRQWTIDVVSRQADHLSHLVDDLLDVSRVTHGKIHLRRGHVELRDVIESSLDAVRAQAQFHRIELRIAAESLRTNGDPVRLRQVVVNLLDNAIKFTPRNKPIVVELRREANNAVIRVVDEGIGIAEELIGSLFAPFAPGEQMLSRSPGGLGLALVRRLVELHGGSVAASSAGRGKGSTFAVTLPLVAGVAPPPPSPSTSVQAPHPEPRRLRLLVVDDNADAAEMIGHVLEAAGHRVVLAFDGASAIESVTRTQPDVVLLDLGLPDIDGLEVARHLRIVAPEVRLIALTGYGDTRMRARVRDSGFADHLLKPVDRDVLHRALDAITPRPR